jgi:penicillin amidase
MEMWRRTRTGELSEVLGSSHIEHDRVARLMKYRGDIEADWSSCSQGARLIVDSFTRGINGCIDTCGDNLPIEFQLLGFKPKTWQPEHCLLRQFSPTITFNAAQELARADMISQIGLEDTLKYMPTDPPRSPTVVPEVDLSKISPAILSPFDFSRTLNMSDHDGSNCWAVAGELSSTGKPLLASDPHRPLMLPSLRYVCHLIAPQWNVIGAGEPSLPGIALGHNDRIAFGFTVAQFDQTDLYVETLSKDDAQQYRVGDDWVKMSVAREAISVKGRNEAVEVVLKFTRHGPIIWENIESNRALALRWTGEEAGAAAYLGCLGVDQAHDWASFCSAIRRWRMPSENMIYADVDNNIGWIAVGLLPIRQNWDGLLPVPGSVGRFEWSGFRGIEEMPQEFNPPRRYVASANHNIVPTGSPVDIGFDWKASYRIDRIRQVLEGRTSITVEDFKLLQTDEFSLRARRLVTLMRDLQCPTSQPIQHAVAILNAWDFVLAQNSAPAALFEIWLSRIRSLFLERHVNEFQRNVARKYLQTETIVQLLQTLSADDVRTLLMDALTSAVQEGSARLGPDMSRWRWGALHKARFYHSIASDSNQADTFDIGDFECGGDEETVNSTRGPDYGCNYGPSYRQIIDLADWDRSLFINAPGQSGDPRSRHYGDHLCLWQRKEYVPLLYSRAAVERHTIQRLTLRPVCDSPHEVKNSSAVRDASGVELTGTQT